MLPQEKLSFLKGMPLCYLMLSWLQSNKSPGLWLGNCWKVKFQPFFLILVIESLTTKWGWLVGSQRRGRPKGKGAKNTQRDRRAASTTLFVFLWATSTLGRSCIHNTTFVASKHMVVCYNFWKPISKGRTRFALHFCIKLRKSSTQSKKVLNWSFVLKALSPWSLPSSPYLLILISGRSL